MVNNKIGYGDQQWSGAIFKKGDKGRSHRDDNI